MSNPGIFGDLAEKILAIDGLQRPTKQTGEFKPSFGKFLRLVLRHPVNNLRWRASIDILEALGDSIKGSRSGDDEIRFGEIQDRRVVEINRKLKGKERAHALI